MKNVTIVAVLTVFALGFVGDAWAFEGGTKLVTTMIQPARAENEKGPLILVSGDLLAPGKAAAGFMRRAPEPTLSIERIREEKPGRSLGTKTAVLFQREGRL